MLLKGFARVSVLPTIILLGIAFHGCSDQDVKYADPIQSARPAPATTPRPTPDPDQAAGLVTRFYRDVDAATKESIRDISTIASPAFFRDHHGDFITDYAFISDPKVQIRAVGGRTVDYTLDYIYLTSGNGKLYWERTGHWTFNHGTRGWVLDTDTWDSVHLVGLSTAVHPEVVAVQDKVNSDGRHVFSYLGETWSFLAQGDNWHITPVPTATPAAQIATADTYTTASTSSSVAQSTTSYQAPPLPTADSTDCEEVEVSGVYDDGKVLELDDGRHLRVNDVDTVTSGVWVAPLDGMICDSGGRFIDKDDNEAVDLAY